MTEAQALYLRDGDAFVATSCTQNAWHENAQSGGAVLALLGHVLEDLPTPSPMSLTRLTVDLMRPVPIGQPLWIDQTVTRQGRLIQVVDAVLRSADTEYVRSRALRIRDEDQTTGAHLRPTTDDASVLAQLPAPEDLASVDDRPGMAGFLVTGAEFRRSAGEHDGPHCAWVRLRVPVVDGEPIRATSRVAMPMDCVNLIGVAGLPQDITAINPDVSAHVMRAPVGEWVALVGDTRFSPPVGHGFSSATMADRAGVFGITSTSQVVQRHG